MEKIIAGNFRTSVQADKAVRLGVADRDTAIEKLSQQKPVAIEEADGEWQDGEWKDFDPVARPKVVWRGERKA